MKWQKAKTILIIYFITINLILSAYIIANNVNSGKVDAQVTDTVVQLLEKNSIGVNKELIIDASKQQSMKTVYVKNIIENYESFAKLSLGENVVRKDKSTYIGENGKIIFDGDYFSLEANDGQYLEKTDINRINAVKTAQRYILGMGVLKKNLNGELKENDTGFLVSFVKKTEGFEVYGAGINVEMTKDGIKKVYGSWYNEQEGQSAVMELKNPSGALIEYMNDQKSGAGAKQITDIRLGYATLESMIYHESIMLTPVWAIFEDSGQTVYINAREN